VGLSPNSYDVIFRGVVAEEFLPLPQCKLLPAHIREWSFYVSSKSLQLVSAEFHSDLHFVSFETRVLCDKSEVCTVQVSNECHEAGEMRVQAVLSFSQHNPPLSTSFYIRKRCGGTPAEGLQVSFQPSPFDSPISVISNGVQTAVAKAWLGVSEEHQSSFITISSWQVVDTLSVGVRDREVMDVRVTGDLREVAISFLEVGQSSRLIDNLSEEYMEAVSSKDKLSIKQLELILNGQTGSKASSSHIRIDPDTILPDFPPFLPENSGPTTDHPIQIRIDYICFEPGVTEVQFHLRLNHTFNPYEPVQFSWDKTCGGYINPYLLIGSAANQGDILQQGLVQSDYNSGNYVVAADTGSHFFYLSVLEGEQRVAQPEIATSDLCTADISPIAYSVLVPMHPANFSVAYQCKHRGECSVRLLIDMIPPLTPYGKVELSWRKHCGGHIKGLNVYSKEAVERHMAADIMVNGTYVAQGPLIAEGDEVSIGLNSALLEPLSVSFSASCDSLACSPRFPQSPSLKLTSHKQVFTFAVVCHSSGPSVLTLTLSVSPT